MKPLIVAIAVLAAGPATAQFAACEYLDPHAGEFNHVDLGGGYVANEATLIGTPEFGARGFIVINNCAGPEQMLATTFSTQDGLDVTVAARARFAEMVASDAAVTLADVASALSAAGAQAEVRTFERLGETCGCHVAYPELRGDLPEYEATQ